MKKYFLYRLKQCFKPFILLLVFGLVIYVMPLCIKDYSYWNDPQPLPEGYPEYLYRNVNLYLVEILIAAGLMAVITPVYMFAYKMNKRSVDMYYSLPVTRTTIFAVHFLAGLVCLYAAYTLSYWIGFVVAAIKIRRLKLVYYLYIYLSTLIPVFAIYAVSTFLYTRANTVIDGIVFIIAGFLAGGALTFAAENISAELFDTYYSFNAVAFTPMGLLNSTSRLISAISGGGVDLWDFSESLYPARFLRDITELTGGILYTGLSGIATAYMLKTERDCRAENCQQISESLFGYKTVIPLYLISCCVWFADSLAITAVMSFAAIVATIVWRRTFKIGKNRAILLAAYIVIAILAAVLVVYLPPFIVRQPAY